MRTPDPIGSERDREWLGRARSRTQENIRRAREDEQDEHDVANRPPQEDRRSGQVVRACASESRPAAGADLTGALTVRPDGKAASPVAHAGTGGTTPAPDDCPKVCRYSVEVDMWPEHRCPSGACHYATPEPGEDEVAALAEVIDRNPLTAAQAAAACDIARAVLAAGWKRASHWHDPDPERDEPTCTVPPPVGYVIKGPTRIDDVIYPRDRAVARAAALTDVSARRGLNEVYIAVALVPVVDHRIAEPVQGQRPEARWACSKCGVTRRAAGSRICSVIGDQSLMEHVWTVTL